MPTVRAIGERVLVEFEDRPKVTDGGIIIPDQWQELPCFAVVVSVGGRVRERLEVGQRVIVKKWMDAEPCESGGRVCHFMAEDHVLGADE